MAYRLEEGAVSSSEMSFVIRPWRKDAASSPFTLYSGFRIFLAEVQKKTKKHLRDLVLRMRIGPH
jgi:hypothetical protein